MDNTVDTGEKPIQQSPTMTTRSISIFLLVVGLLWGLIVSGLDRGEVAYRD
jgi:hypothetical protein